MPTCIPFHRYPERTRLVEGRDANQDTIDPEKYNGGERDYNSNNTNNT